jgi:Meckel syndrome type 1 protein
VNSFLPPTLPPRQKRFAPKLAERPTIDQYLLLSMLVHVFIIVAFGDTTGGTSKTLGSIGGITVSLRGLAPAPVAPASPGGGLKMDTGRFLPPTDATAASAPAAASKSPAPSGPAAAPPPQSRQPDLAAPEIPQVLAKPVEKPVTDFVVPAPVAGRDSTAPADQGARPIAVVPVKIEPLAPVKPDTGFAAFVDSPRLPEPVQVTPLPAPLAPIFPPKMDAGFAPPVVLTPPTMPTLTKLPAIAAPLPTPELAPYRAPTLSNVPVVTPAPLETLPAPRINQTFAAPTEAKALAEPVAAPAPLAPLPPVQLDREFAAPVEVRRTDIIVAPPSPLTPLPPATVNRELTPYIEQRARELPAAAATPAATAPVTATPSPAASKPASGDTLTNPATAPGISRDAVLPGATQSNPNDSRTTPRINLDSLKDRARAITREGTGPRTVFPSLTAPKPPPKSATQEAFDKALKRPDCKDVYADMGLAAVIPLVRDAVTEKGCKW